MSYPFDAVLRERVTDLLYEVLPALYRTRDLGHGGPEPLKDAAPPGTEELRKFLRVLAAPLAEVRQSVDELHADLFVDSCQDAILPYLAEMIGMRLVFPDADANRRDVRGTVGWRRRKGTPLMLQEMASALAAQIVVTHEGWKRLALTQHLARLRPERVIPALVDPAIAERAAGPLDAAFHAVDLRTVDRATGRYHPLHVAHWLHPTRLFPVREGTPARFVRPGPASPPVAGQDSRWTFHPLGALAPLRVRRRTPSDPLATDRVPPMNFAASPATWFDQTGEDGARFTVRIAGLPAAVAEPVREERAASGLAAHAALTAAAVDLQVLDLRPDRLTRAVAVDVMAVPLAASRAGGPPDTPKPGAAVRRGTLEVSDAGGAFTVGDDTSVPGPVAAMLRLRPLNGPFAFFPGTVIEVASRSAEARRALDGGDLGQRGFLRGALLVEVPPIWIRLERWLYVSVDGSLHDAQTDAAAEAGAAPDVPVLVDAGGAVSLPGDPLVVGPHPAWPPSAATCSPEPFAGGPVAPGRGPVVLRAAPALDLQAGARAAAGLTMALAFALHARGRYRPLLRLEWTGPDPAAAARFTLLGAGSAAATTAAEAQDALAAAAHFDAAEDGAELLVRLESGAAGIVLPPCELAYCGHEGRSVLVHLPELGTTTQAASAIRDWPGGDAAASAPVRVQDDGSTALHPSGAVARYAYGPIAPVADAATLRRRRLRHRALSGWLAEAPGATPPKLVPFTPPGALDLDPEAGLFALAGTEVPPPYPTSIEALAPASTVTVDFQDGSSDHVGARPAARAPLLGARLAAPTRVVMGAGRFQREGGSGRHTVPRHRTLSDALAAIALGPRPLVPDEVVEVQDSATYDETLVWPEGLRSLVVQAAEHERPVLRLGAPVAAGEGLEERITLVGLAFAHGGRTFALPAAPAIRIVACSVLDDAARWTFSGRAGAESAVEIEASVLGAIDVDGRVAVSVADSILDTAAGRAISAPDARVTLERATVATQEALPPDGFAVDVKVLDASDTLFTGRVRARDRFAGGIRYSRAAPESELPRHHRLVEDEPRFVARDRRDPTHLRLAERCPASIVRGAADGSELGAFHGARLAQRVEALARRIDEYTPAGLRTGLIRLD
jgi:hypothetical protein